jgi:hypothetical protein
MLAPRLLGLYQASKAAGQDFQCSCQRLPPVISVSFRIVGGRSGGGRLVASRSVNRALHLEAHWFGGRSHGRDSLGQSRAILARRSHSGMSAPYFSANRASRY